MVKLAGICPALVTPLASGGGVNVKVTERLIESLISAGVGGLYACGGTGEWLLLSPEVRRQMAEVAIAAAAGRVPVVVHIGAATTEQAVELARHAKASGADAISAVPPFYYGYPFTATVEYYRAIATASGLPLYIYHIPGATGAALSPEELLELCAMEGIVGLKYSSHDLDFLSKLLAMRDPDHVNVVSGPDELFLSCFALGVEGAIGTTYNFMPRLYIDIMQSAIRGELATARRLQYAANAVIRVLLPYGGIPATKAVLTMMGFDVGYCVPPMPAIDGEVAELLRRDMEVAGLFGLLKRNALYGPPGDPMRGKLA